MVPRACRVQGWQLPSLNNHDSGRTAPRLDPVTSSTSSATSVPTHRVLFGAVAVGWVLADQLTKWWAVSSLKDNTIDVVWTLRFQLLTNYGASFSLGAGYGAWIGILALVVVGISRWRHRFHRPPVVAGLQHRRHRRRVWRHPPRDLHASESRT